MRWSDSARIVMIFTCVEVGVNNQLLWGRLSPLQKSLSTTAALGVPPVVEAMAFAWLAKRCLEGLPGNLPSVTERVRRWCWGYLSGGVKLLAMREELAAGSAWLD